VKLLYFAHLAKKLRRESEELELPEQVTNVTALLGLLCRRKPAAAPLFVADQVRITVNRQFAEPFTRLEDGDEIALVPTSPVAPPTPDLV
jgi:molybdopterin converting factor small subunit